MNKFKLALEKKNQGRPPVWFMRQAGRYHSHYQSLRQRYSFMDLCKLPEVACEAALGPVHDFGFDAAILFSDLLFPLEAMGMGLQYEEGPKLSWHLRTLGDLERFKKPEISSLHFQGDALRLTREKLSPSKGLLGFVGGPLTLFYYAVEGSHSGELRSAREGLWDGRYEGFVEILLDLLAKNMSLQAKAGVDSIAVLDTCAGDLDPETYSKKVVPVLEALFERFYRECPEYSGFPITYYSKGTVPEHWQSLEGLPISCLGIDWNQDLPSVLRRYGKKWAIQGNINPSWLFQPEEGLEKNLRKFFSEVKSLPTELLQGWICGLGHGVLPKTPEASVRLFLKIQREVFGEAEPRSL